MSGSKLRSEGGAILIQVAVVLLGLTLFSAFVVDYGIMWTSRAQVQTSADSAALAGAQALTFDNTTEDNVKLVAQKVGKSNAVWLESPDIQTTDITIIDCPPTPGLPTGDKCIQARAYRNQARNNPLPTIFAQLAGVDDQGVQALAVARAVSGTSVTCLKPWAVGDKWFDTQVGGWNQSATFDSTKGDYYDPPTPANQYQGTGFSATKPNGDPDYYGYQMILKLDNPGQGNGGTPIDSSGWAMELCLNNANDNNPCNTPAYQDNINGCTSDVVNLSQWDAPTCTAVDPSIGCLGVKTGGTGAINSKAVGDFLDSHDPNATWSDGDGASGWQTGFITPGSGHDPSEDIVPVAIFSVPEYLDQDAHGGGGIVRVLKVVGFFMEGTCADNIQKESYLQCPGGGSDKAAVVGRLVNYVATGPVGPANGGFGKILTLVR
jgi:hypothetical protein